MPPRKLRSRPAQMAQRLCKPRNVTWKSYIHPEAIKRVTGITVEVGDDEDYTVKFGGLLKVKKAEAKAILANEVAPAMTVGEIDERDGKKEIRGWLMQLSKMANQ